MVKRKDLTGVGDKDSFVRQGEYMACQQPDCDGILGGTRGDYFELSMDYIFTCPVCGSDNIAIVKDVTTQKIIKR